MKLVLSCFCLLLAGASLKCQTGFGIGIYGGYRLPLSASNLSIFNESSLTGNSAANTVSWVGSYGQGICASVNGSYSLQLLEMGGFFTYHTTSMVRTVDDNIYSRTVYKSNTLSITPYIRFKKNTKGPFVPFIQIGFPVAFAQVTIDTKGKDINSQNYFSYTYVPRQLMYGINGGIGFYNRLNGHWQLVCDLSFTGINFIPNKVFFTTGSDTKASTTTEQSLNTKDDREKFGRSAILPFSNWGLNLGFRYNFKSLQL